MSDQRQSHREGKEQFRAGLIGFGIDEEESESGHGGREPEPVRREPQAAADTPPAAELVDPVIDGPPEGVLETPSPALPEAPSAALQQDASAEDMAAESRLAERMAGEFPLQAPVAEPAHIETTAAAAPARDHAVISPVFAIDDGEAACDAALAEAKPAVFDLRAHLDETAEDQPEAAQSGRVGARLRHYGLYAASFALAAALGWFGSSYVLPGGFRALDRHEAQEIAAVQPAALPAMSRPGQAGVPVQDQTAAVGARKADGPSLTDEIRSLKEGMGALRASLEALKGSAEAVKANAERSERDAASRLSQIVERLDRVERTERDPAAKLTQLAERLERMERQIAAAATTSVAQPAPAPEAAKPAVVEGWVLREVYDGVAVIEGRNGGVREVTLGQTIPGVGRVEAIQRRGKDWIVITSRGVIPMERW